MNAPSFAVRDRQAPRVALHPNLAVRRSGPDYLVSSPVLRQTVVLSADEWNVLQGLAGGDGEAAANRPAAPAMIYLQQQKYLALGLLVEAIVLTPDEIGALHVVPRTLTQDMVAQASGAWSRNVRIDDLLDTTGAIPLSDDFDDHRFRALLHDRGRPEGAQQKLTEPPLQVCARPDGALALLTDTERACAARRKGFALPAHRLKPGEFLFRLVDAPAEFFGTARGRIPYQSIIHRGEELVQGRRTDVDARLGMIRPDDLQGKRVLDLGCNIGMSCHLAIERGARVATGIDLPDLAAVATRLNVFFGNPCRFVAADLNRGVAALGDHETVFVFALIGHLDRLDGVFATIESVNARTVYVETHCEIQPQGDLAQFLGAPVFERVAFLGHCLDNVVRQRRTRSFYRCTVRL